MILRGKRLSSQEAHRRRRQTSRCPRERTRRPSQLEAPTFLSRGEEHCARLRRVGGLDMVDTAAIAELLHEAAETHHVVYRIVDGDDPDWASWYADWLLALSELPDELGTKPVRSQLVHALVELDREYTAATPDERWEDFYARGLVARFGG